MINLLSHPPDAYINLFVSLEPTLLISLNVQIGHQFIVLTLYSWALNWIGSSQWSVKSTFEYKVMKPSDEPAANFKPNYSGHHSMQLTDPSNFLKVEVYFLLFSSHIITYLSNEHEAMKFPYLGWHHLTYHIGHDDYFISAIFLGLSAFDTSNIKIFPSDEHVANF